MFEPRDDVEARRLCRLYLRVFDAGPAGASLAPEDALGPADLLHRRGTDDAGLVRRLLADGPLDRAGTRDGAACWALPPRMREAMDEERGGASLAGRLRALLDRADGGEDGLGVAFRQVEHEIRTGSR